MADIFYKSEYIESFGRGTLEIIKECRNYALPLPVFKENNGIVSVDFFNDTVNTKNDRESLILSMLLQNNKSTVEILADRLHISTRTIKRELKKMQNAGLIKREGSDKTGYWIVRK